MVIKLTLDFCIGLKNDLFLKQVLKRRLKTSSNKDVSKRV